MTFMDAVHLVASTVRHDLKAARKESCVCITLAAAAARSSGGPRCQFEVRLVDSNCCVLSNRLVRWFE